MSQKRVMSGMRPTGKLHLGNMFGALTNWVGLQDYYQCFFSVVDWHALTTGYEDTSNIKSNIREMVLDWLSVGIDPEKSVIFVQSHVKEHAELHLLLSMITPLSWLERNPTYKEQLRELEGRNITNYGFLGYPVLQAADILAYKADIVPVGEDQLPHLELCREIVRRFNYLYKPVFPEPQAVLTEARTLPGIDNRKMSKSYNNTIDIADPPEEIRRKVKLMITDPERIRKTDPGHPDICSIHAYYKIFGDEKRLSEVRQACTKAEIGCVQCKKNLSDLMIEYMAPIHKRREEYSNHPEMVVEIINAGGRKARQVAAQTLEQVREAMKI